MQLFQRYGCVTECDVLGNYAFVHMMMEDEASRAIKELNGCLLNGSRLNVELSTATTQGKRKIVSRFGSTKIFVGNIRDGTTSDQLRILFEAFGKVVEADVLSGFGFVHMENESEAQKAICSLNGHILNGNRLNVEMSTSTTQGKARDRDSRGGRGALGVRYDPYALSASMPRRAEPFAVDTYVGVTAGPSYIAADTYVTPAAAAVYPRTAISSDTFARDLLELYSSNPTAFAAYARSPLVRQSLNLGGTIETVSFLPAEDVYGRGVARGDFYEKNVGTRLADLTLAPPMSAMSAMSVPATIAAMSAPSMSAAASVDPYAALRDPASSGVMSRGFSAMRVAAPPPGIAFGAAGPAGVRGAQLVTQGTAVPAHLYAPQFQ